MKGEYGYMVKMPGEGIKPKELFEALVKDRGYSSIGEFCRLNGLNHANLSKHFDHNGISMEKICLYCNLLAYPIDAMLRWFYRDEFIKNERLTRRGLFRWEEDSKIYNWDDVVRKARKFGVEEALLTRNKVAELGFKQINSSSMYGIVTVKS